MGLEHFRSVVGIMRIVTVGLSLILTILPHSYWPLKLTRETGNGNATEYWGSHESFMGYFWVVSFLGLIISAVMIALILLNVLNSGETNMFWRFVDCIYHFVFGVLLFLAFFLICLDAGGGDRSGREEFYKVVTHGETAGWVIATIFQFFNFILYFIIATLSAHSILKRAGFQFQSQGLKAVPSVLIVNSAQEEIVGGSESVKNLEEQDVEETGDKLEKHD